MLLYTSLPSCLSCCIINQWIELKDVARLDSAFCVKQHRSILLGLLSSAECVVETEMHSSDKMLLNWLMKRKVKAEHFVISRNVDEELGFQYVKLLGFRVKKMLREESRHRYYGVPDDLGEDIIKHVCVYGNLTHVECCNLSVPMLNEILSRNPFLQDLNFSVSCGGEANISTNTQLPQMLRLRPLANVNMVMHLISLSPNLKVLNLDGSPEFTDSHLLTIASKCRHLNALSLQSTTSSAAIYTQICAICFQIESLNLMGTHVTDIAMESIAINLTHLRRFNLQSCIELTNASLHSLEQHCASTLELLWLCDTTHITTPAIQLLKETLPTLRVHYLMNAFGGLPVPDTTYCLCTALRVFFVPFTDMVSFVAQSNLPVLQVLCIFGYDEDFQVVLNAPMMNEIICNCPQLRTIGVFDNNVSRMKDLLTSIGSNIAVVRFESSENGLEHVDAFPL